MAAVTPPDGAVFFAGQGALQTAAVHRKPKLFLNGLNTGDGRQARFGRSQAPYIFDDLGRQLVPFFGAPLLGQQAAQAGLLECGLGLVDRRSRDAKPGSHLDDRDPLDAVVAQHLVTNLEKIFRIEEWILLEQPVGNRIGMRVEGARPFQLHGFLIDFPGFGHPTAPRE